eukprot:TRINITY_DN29615_c0_g1_i1.p1 TRINITY_DN29615_c0_g1~~TRINITY_DN29615_c0_g1_i1.p1  ORF type:complete len:237 (+),score=30.15 TRINITY_DN29615_c0_g1_i1:48-758(+)
MGEVQRGKRQAGSTNSANPDDSTGKKARAAHPGDADAIDVDSIPDPQAMPQGNCTGDLACFIDHRKTCCANEDPQNPHTNIFSGVPRMLAARPDGFLLSDCDPQLLLEIGFTGAVRLQRLELKAPGDGRAPGLIRLFTNSPSMDFNSVEDAAPTESFDLCKLWTSQRTRDPDHAGATDSSDVSCSIVLNAARFRSVNTLTVFIQQGVDDACDKTCLHSLTAFGARIHKVTVVPGVL